MAKGSICRKKGRQKWYYRFYITGENGKPKQIERAGTESKAETERMLRHGMAEHKNRQFIAQNSNLTLEEVIDMWLEEGLKPSSLANGTVHPYMNEVPPEDYIPVNLVCVRHDGEYQRQSTTTGLCQDLSKSLPGLGHFYFHQLRHTYISNLLATGAAPKDVQELLGHADISTTINIYAHAERESKRTTARLLDKLASGE